MADVTTSPPAATRPKAKVPWRGVVAFALLGAVGSLGPDLTQARYLPNLDFYVRRYVLLALSIGFALSAVCSRVQLDRLIGIAVLVVGMALLTYIIDACLSLSGQRLFFF